MDLSKMLDELYKEEEENDESGEPAGPEPEGPEWAEEARLEEVFSSWTPGPPAEAPDAEREMAEGFNDGGDLQAELEDRDADDFDAVMLEPGDLEDARPLGWTRSQDDVLAGGRRSPLSLLLRR